MIQSNNIFSLTLSHRLVNIDDFDGMGTIVCACCLFQLYMALRILRKLWTHLGQLFIFCRNGIDKRECWNIVHFVEF
jgi:hypothetical protein